MNGKCLIPPRVHDFNEGAPHAIAFLSCSSAVSLCAFSMEKVVRWPLLLPPLVSLVRKDILRSIRNLGNGCIVVDYGSVGWLVFPVTLIGRDQCLPSPLEKISVVYTMWKHFSMKTFPGNFLGKNS